MLRGGPISAMEKEIKNSVKCIVTTKDIWDELKENFGKDNAPRAYKLRRTVTTVQQGNMKVSSCYTKLKSVWDEMR